MAETQLALGFEARAPALGRSEFWVAPCNLQAVTAVDRWPDWPRPVLVVTGPEGAGKSHLAEVWRAASKAQALSLAALAAWPLPELEGPRTWLVDPVDPDVPLGASPESAREHEVALCRALDALARGRGLLMTSREPPDRWRIALPDLRTRLAGLPFVELGPPDDVLLAKVAAKLFADRQLDVAEVLIGEIVALTERSCSAVKAAVEAIDAASLAQRQRVLTRAFIQNVLVPRESR